MELILGSNTPTVQNIPTQVSHSSSIEMVSDKKWSLVYVSAQLERLSFFHPMMVDEVLHAMIKESMLEERNGNAYGVMVKFFGRPASKRNIHKLALLKWDMKAPFKIENLKNYEFKLNL